MTQPRDKYGRFKKVVKPRPIIQTNGEWEWISFQKPNRKFERVDSSASATRFSLEVKKQNKNHDITMRALLWTTVGFLSGVIFEMFVQLVTR